MINTTTSEDRIINRCRDFGGAASELVDAVERLDALVSRKDDEISRLENQIGELEAQLEEARNNQAEP